MLISTNILFDSDQSLDYIATPNTQIIFERVTNSIGKNSSSFNLIGSYGTGKSSFLVALESTLTGKKSFFTNSSLKGKVAFIKVLGSPNESLRVSISKELGLSNSDEDTVISAILSKSKEQSAQFLLIDEFGKCIEYALSNNPKRETYFFQKLAEAINNNVNTTLVTTQHQNFDAYESNASSADLIEWEKVSGRFIPLVFNEPPETLLRLAEPRLRSFERTEETSSRLDKVISSTNLLPKSFSNALKNEIKSISPLDGLSAYCAINLLQKYGQNERSLFSFLNSTGEYSLESKDPSKPYLLCDFYDYSINRLGHFIYSNRNPDKLQWEAAERAIQRSDHHSSIDPKSAHAILKSILLINLFTREGIFDAITAREYFKIALGSDAQKTLNELFDKSIIQFLRYKNKLSFVEGTDINIQNELISAERDVPKAIDTGYEILRFIDLPPVLAKRHYLTTGTPRFGIIQFNKDDSIDPAGLNGNEFIEINLGKESNETAGIQCDVTDIEDIHSHAREVLKYEWILEKYSEDFAVKRIIKRELQFSIDRLEGSFYALLFNKSNWRFNGSVATVRSLKELNSRLSDYFSVVYSDAPIIVNELINKSVLSPSVNTARRALLRRLLSRAKDPSLGYESHKYPADKTIFYSTVVKEGMYNQTTGTLYSPKADSSYFLTWQAGERFLDESRSGKRSLSEIIRTWKNPPYGLKDGLLRIWLMLFLATKEEEYALFYSPENKFLPYFSDAIYEEILKKPHDFVVKKYNYDRLPQSLLDEYRVHSAYLDDTNLQNARTAYFRIYGELLSKVKNLVPFVLQTKSRISKEATGFRDALINANDPEEALLQEIPNSLGFTDLASFEVGEAQNYFERIRDVESELGGCFDSLLDEFYVRIQRALIGEKEVLNLHDLKVKSSALFSSIDENRLEKNTRILLKRLISPLDVKASWTKAVVDHIVGKNCESLVDSELSNAFERTDDAIDSLLEANQLHSSVKHENKFSIKITLANGETIRRSISRTNERTETLKSKEIEELANRLLSALDHD